MIVYAVITVLCITLQMYVYWVQSKGIVPYRLNIIVALTHMTSNFVMAAYDPETSSILLWTPLELWIVLMMIRGIMLEKERK